MKHIAKRGFSMVLVLAMVISLFAGLTLNASAAQPTSANDVNYVTSGKYVYNWGKRDTTATFLTTYAQQYYTGDYTYAKLSALSGNSASGTGFYTSAMGTAIHNMLVAKQSSTTSYDATKNLYQYTDCEEGGGAISSYYSAVSIGPSWNGSWNREHTWPNSKGLNGSDENDIMMLRPTSTSENSSRGNTAYGEGSGYYDPNQHGQNLRGDVARLMLQHLMRWGNTNSFYGSGGVMQSRAVLLKWIEEDPVDTWEMGRNDAVQQITGVRNVFVDYPELGFLLLGEDVPADYQTPSGIGAGSQYKITATSNNTNYGTVSVSGRTITASPKSGYYASGYEVTKGTATVTQNGNVFTVSPTSDCTVCINFAAKQSASLSFSVPAGVTTPNTLSGYSGDSKTLPTPSGTPSGGSYTYTFKGWVPASVKDATAQPPTVYAAGSSYTLSGNTTLYALYSYFVQDGQGSSQTRWQLITDLTKFDAGTYALLTPNYKAFNGAFSSGNGLVTSTAFSFDASGYADTAPSGTLELTAEATTGGFRLYNESKGYLYTAQAKSGGLAFSSSEAKGVWTGESAALKCVEGTVTAHLRTYSNSSFRPYSSATTNNPLLLAKKVGGVSGTTYYTTVIGAQCNHTYTTVVTAPTCTAGGYTTYTCSKCGFSYTDNSTTALGHAYGTATSNGNGTHTAACSRCGKTVTEDCTYTTSVSGATTTFTCSVCNYSYQATKDTYTVTFRVPGFESDIAPASVIEGNSITLPTVGTVDGYTFAGWTTAAIDPENTTVPTILTGSYKPTANTTLYALYTHTEQVTGTGSGNYEKVTEISDLKDGQYLIVYETGKVALDGSLSTIDAAKNTVAVTFSNGEIVSDKNTENAAFVFSASGKSFYGTNGKYLNCNTAKKLNLSDTAVSHTISFSSGNATINAGSNLRFNKASDQMRFRCYASGQEAIQLYKKTTGSSSTTYYTTNPTTAVTCDHANAYDVAEVSATCTEAGTTAGKYCPDCEQWLSGHTEIPALGHDLSENTTPATCTTAGETVTSCSCCDYSVSTPIAALGHNYDNGVITTAPTATAEGVMTYTCDRCGDFYTSVIPALGEKIPYTRATEITSGSNYIMAFHYTYNGADKWYGIGGVNNSACTIYELPAPVNGVVSLDNGEAFLWTIDAVSDTTNGYSLKNGNSYLKGTSTSTNLSTDTTAVTWTAVDGKADDTFWFKIGDRGIGLQSGSSVKNYAVSNATNTGTSYVFDIYLFANTCAHSKTELQGAVEATCTTNGYTGDVVCLDCGAVVTTGTKILQGHDYVEASRTEATCETAGNIHYECSRCDSEKNVAIAALGHNYEQSAHVDATCTADGYTTYTCANDASHTYTETLTAIGHNYDSETGICANCGDQLSSFTVSFTVPAGINAIDPITAFDGAKINLPEPTGTLAANAENYQFAGWVTTDVTDETDTDFIEAGEYTVTGDVTFKALYTWVGEGSFGDDGVYKLLTEEDAASLDTDWMLVIANDGKWQSKTMALADYTSGGNEKFAGKTVTVTNNTITVPASSDVQQFTVVKDADSGYFYLISNYTDNEDTLYYLTSCTNTANANNITLTANPTAAALWSISYHEDGTVKLTAQGSWTANTVQFNSSNYNGFFSCYGETYYGNAPTNIYGIRLFASNPIFHFTTAPVQTCDHENVTWTDNRDGTCTCTCDDCGHIVADHEAHAWVLDETAEGTVAATCTVGGKEGYVCSNCGATKLEDTAALDHDYVGVETTAPICSAEGVMTYTCSRCDDSYTESISAVDHSFVDGTCTMCGASLYVLVTEAPENWEGEYLIAYVNGENAKVFDGKHDAAANYTVGTFYGEEGNESNLICVPNPDDYMVMFDPNGSGYRIMNSDANWWSYTQASNGFSTNSSTSFAGTYNISLDANGNAVIKNAGNYSVKFNTQSSQFRFYGTSIDTTVKLYEKYGSCHHNWVLDEAASTAATCGVAGNNVYECSICHETKNETVPALQHDYYYNEVPATCTAEGYTECYCHNCDYAEILSYSIVPALGHDFSIEPAVTDEDHYIAPTATEEGLMYCQCSRCGEWDTDGTIIPALGVVTTKTYTMLTASDFNSYETALTDVEQFIIVAESDGKYYALSENGNGTVLNAVEIPVSGTNATVASDSGAAVLFPDYEAQNYAETVTGLGFKNIAGEYLHLNSSKMDFGATGENGLFTVEKAYTNDTFTLSVSATGKYIVYDDGEFTMATKKTNAAKLYIFVANALDITYNGTAVSTLTVDADSEGNLGYVLNVNVANEYAMWSSDNEDVITINDASGAFLTGSTGTANVTVNVYTYDETWQNYKLYTATIPVVISGTHVHSYGADGICTGCGDKLIDIVSATLRLDEDIDVIYTASIPAGATASMTFTMNGESVTVADDGTHTFAFEGVNPQCMGDNISAKLNVTIGDTTYTCTKDSYSVRQYCVNKLADTSVTGEIRTLISDVLAYGAAAQTYMSYNTSALVNAGADIKNPNYSTFSTVSGYTPSFNGTAAADVRWIAAGLTLTDSVAMTFRFYAESVDGLTVTVAIGGRTQTFTSSDFAAVGGKANTYEISFAGIMANEFADNVTASFARNGAQVGNSVSYSVNAYVQSKQSDSNASLAALVKALYNYGASAAAVK